MLDYGGIFLRKSLQLTFYNEKKGNISASHFEIPTVFIFLKAYSLYGDHYSLLLNNTSHVSNVHFLPSEFPC